MGHMLPMVNIDRVLRRRSRLHIGHTVQRAQRAQRILFGDLAGRLGGVVGFHVDARLPVKQQKKPMLVLKNTQNMIFFLFRLHSRIS